MAEGISRLGDEAPTAPVADLVKPASVAPALRLGLRANWQQFTLLVVINAFVGTMVGVERAVLPLLAEREFGLTSAALGLSFIAAFGLAKALANLLAGRLSETWGRKQTLVLGWLLGLPVPLLVMFAPGWGWVVAANVLLGINQGLAWSMTVNMKIDLVGPQRRGLALGLNEFAGYLAVGAAALASAWLAETLGLRPYPFALALVAALLGLGLSALFVRDTGAHVRIEQAAQHKPGGTPSGRPHFCRVFTLASWRDRSLFSVSQAGLVNNLNDALAWGMLPILFVSRGMSLGQVGLLAAAYPAIWGIGQLATGALSDSLGRKPMIVAGMLVQAAGIWIVAVSGGFGVAMAGVTLLGLGTAMVYPTLLAAVGDLAEPGWRASAVGVYRFWRDAGFAVGAVGTGLVADALGAETSIHLVALLTLGSGLLAARLMRRGRAVNAHIGAPSYGSSARQLG